MDTVLNLGLNETNLPVVAKEYGWRFALDCMRRLLDMFGDVVLGMPHELFEAELQAVKDAAGITFDVDLGEDDLRAVVQRFRGVYAAQGKSMPSDPYEQLEMAICAVFGSWHTPRAVKYREINRITGLIGTAVNIQTMVYGNLNDTSATGVCFTRNPATGEPGLFGEFLVNAQGEDVVAGIRTPVPVGEMAAAFPDAFQELVADTKLLETHYHDMQDCEFTVMNNRLFMLQTRNGKRTGQAALRVAVDLKNEGWVLTSTISTDARPLFFARPDSILTRATRSLVRQARLSRRSSAHGRAAPPRAAAPPHLRERRQPRLQELDRGQGSPRVAGCGERPDRLHGRGRRAMEERGTRGDSREDGDFPGGRRRYARG